MKRLTVLYFVFFLIVGCSQTVNEQKKENALFEFDQVADYLDAKGDFINAETTPRLISYQAILAELDKNILIIDIRNADDFDNGHLPGAVNVSQAALLDYFEREIEPSSFDRIVITCFSGQSAAYAAALLALTGYENVYSMKFGMSSVDMNIAQQKWLSRVSGEFESKLVATNFEKSPKGDAPKLAIESKDINSAIRKRVRELLAIPYPKLMVKSEVAFSGADSLYVVNYWPEKLYTLGHIPGAKQYTPKKSLKRDAELLTLPTDKSIVVYCFTGQHAANVVAYLRLLGYSAYSIGNGSNSFMHNLMAKNSALGHAFTKEMVNEVSLVRQDGTSSTPKAEKQKPASAGGC